MQQTRSSQIFQLVFSITFILFSLVPAMTQAEIAAKAAPPKVAFLPFTANAAKDLSYLKDGIRDMLASRLSANAGILVIDKAQVDRAIAAVASGADKSIQPQQMASLASTLQADYLVAGSLTALGIGMSLDARVITASAPANPSTFYATAASEDEVIPAINQLAADIGAKVFGSVPAPTPTAARAQPAAPSGPAAPTAPAAPEYQTAHPERAFLGPMASGSPFIRTGDLDDLESFSKSQNFGFGVAAMEVGDVDGDGADDVVLAAGCEVIAYHRNDHRLSELGRLSLGTRYKIHALSLADLNHNGRAEIYISASDNEEPYSFGAEWRQNGFAFLFKDERWYLKAIDLPGTGMVLAGQRAGSSSALESGIYQLASSSPTDVSGPLTKGAKLPLPDIVNVFSFALADIDGDGESEIIHMDQDDYLNVLKMNGKLIWRSSSQYGGTSRSIGGLEETTQRQEIRDALQPDKAKKVFVPSRIIVADLNHDKLPDVVINRNNLNWSPIFKNIKSYNSGSILGLTWNGIGLTELWYTKRIDGYITDYQFRIPAGGNQAQLYVSLILQTGTLNILSASESTVLMYNLNLEPEKKKDKEKTGQ